LVCLNCRLLFGRGRGGWLPPSATVPPNARLNPQLPIAVIIVHCNFSAVLPSFAPPPPPLPIAIVPPAGHCHHCSHCNHAAGRSHLLPHTRCRCCMLLHARCIRCPLPHTHWLHAVQRNHSPGRHRLLPHTRTLLAAAPMPPLLHTAARTPLPPLLPPPLPPLPLLVSCPVIA
jgi:hypothetical protein